LRVSDDGLYEAFFSWATNLYTPPASVPGRAELYARNKATGVTTRVSNSTRDAQVNQLAMSDDGSVVAFVSDGDPDGNPGGAPPNQWKIYVANAKDPTQPVRRLPFGGVSASESVSRASVSGDGRFLVFTSTQQMNGASNGLRHVYRYDLQSDPLLYLSNTVLVDQTTGGVQANGDGSLPVTNRTGSHVAYTSSASNLVSGDTNGQVDAFVRNVQASSTDRSSMAIYPPTAQLTRGGKAVGVSDDGKRVTFTSDVYTNGYTQTLSRNYNGASPVTEEFTSYANPNQGNIAEVGAVSGDGRKVAFGSWYTGGPGKLWIRDLSEPTSRVVASWPYQTMWHTPMVDRVSVSRSGNWLTSTVPDYWSPYEKVYLTNLDPTYPAAPPEEQSFGPPENCPCRHMPTSASKAGVNTLTGNWSTTQTDATLAGPGPAFNLSRTYNSKNTRTGLFGPGWSTVYDESASLLASGDVEVTVSDGARLVFKKNGASFDRTPGVLGKLTTRTGGGWSYTDNQSARHDFDSSGKLVSLTDRNNLATTLTYTSARLSAVTDPAGRVVAVTTDPTSARVTAVTLPDGRSATYGYTNGRLTQAVNLQGQTTGYTLDGQGRIAVVTDPAGHNVATVTYGADGRVSSKTDGTLHTGSFTWNQASRTSVYTDASGVTHTDVYDLASRLSAQKDGLNNQVTYTWSGRRPTSVTDPLGHATTFTWDGNGRQLTAKDALNHQHSFTYTTAGDVASSTDARGNVTTYTYDTTRRLTSIAEPGGVTRSFTYTNTGVAAALPSSATDGRNKTTSFGYDTAGNNTTITDANGDVVTRTFDSSGRVTSVVDPRGNEPSADPDDYRTTFVYDSLDRLVTATDPLGHVSSNTYDLAGQLVSSLDAAGHATSYTYDNAGRQTSVTDANGHASVTGYDNAGRVTAMVDATGAVTTFAYDAAGRLQSSVSPNGNVVGAAPAQWRTTFTYDNASRRTSVADPSGHVTGFGYDNANRQTSVTDPLGHVTSYTYDADNNQTGVTTPAGTTATVYDARGRAASVTDPRGKVWTTTYDQGDLVTSRSTPLGDTTTYGYDDVGRVTSVVDPRGNAPGGNPALFTSSFTYDAAGNQVSATDALGHTTSTTFDRAGHVDAATDAAGHTTTWVFDQVGRVSSVTDPAGAVTSYTRDNVGQVTARTDALGHTTSWSFDPVGRVTSQTLANGASSSQTFDANGNVTSSTDANSTAAATGPTALFTYDHQSQLASVNYTGSTPDVSYTYDAAGRPTALSDGTGGATFTYDNANRLTGVVRDPSGSPETFAYGYDPSGNQTSSTAPDGTVTSRTFDDASRLTGVSTVGGLTGVTSSTGAYDEAGNLTDATLPNGLSESRDYDRAGKLTGIERETTAGPFDSFTYTYDAIGNPTSTVAALADGTTSTESYRYDQSSRLVGVCQAASCGPSDPTVSSWTFDQVGNRETETSLDPLNNPQTTTSTYDQADQLVSSTDGTTTNTYTYDQNGNQLTAPGRTLVFDANNKIVSATTAAGVTSYSYTGDGLRRFEAGPAGSSKYAWDVTVQGAPALAGVTTTLPGGTASSTTLTHLTSGLAQADASGTSTLVQDALGSVVAQADSSGAVWAGAYKPYGTPGAAHDLNASVPDPVIGYTGGLTDPATGLVHLHARDLDVTQGRFLSRDPVDVPQGTPGFDAYSYVQNRPLALVDPTGRNGVSDWISDRASDAGEIASDFAGDAKDAGEGVLAQGVDMVKSAPCAGGVGALLCHDQYVAAAHDPVGAVKGVGKGIVGWDCWAKEGTGDHFGKCVGRNMLTAFVIFAPFAKSAAPAAVVAEDAAACDAVGGSSGKVGTPAESNAPPAPPTTIAGGPAASAADDIVGLADDYIDITAKGSRVRNVQTSIGRSTFEQNLTDAGFKPTVVGPGKNVVSYELNGARYVVRDAARSTGLPTADYYPAGSTSFTLKIRLTG
jgi:RHS repeat-associated protein